MFIYIGYDYNKLVYMYVYDLVYWNLNNWGVERKCLGNKYFF